MQYAVKRGPYVYLSVRHAVLLGVKVDSKESAWEARDEPVTKHYLLHGTFIVKTATAHGFKPETYNITLKPEHANTDLTCDNVDIPRLRELAVQYVISKIKEGVEVRLIGARDVYLHDSRGLFARFNPQSICTTAMMHKELGEKGDAPTSSVHKKHGSLLQNFNFCWRGGGSQAGWISQETSWVQEWPYRASLKDSFFSGMGQIGLQEVIWIERAQWTEKERLLPVYCEVEVSQSELGEEVAEEEMEEYEGMVTRGALSRNWAQALADEEEMRTLREANIALRDQVASLQDQIEALKLQVVNLTPGPSVRAPSVPDAAPKGRQEKVEGQPEEGEEGEDEGYWSLVGNAVAPPGYRIEPALPEDLSDAEILHAFEDKHRSGVWYKHSMYVYMCVSARACSCYGFARSGCIDKYAHRVVSGQGRQGCTGRNADGQVHAHREVCEYFNERYSKPEEDSHRHSRPRAFCEDVRC